LTRASYLVELNAVYLTSNGLNFVFLLKLYLYIAHT